MNRREFLECGLGAFVAAGLAGRKSIAAIPPDIPSITSPCQTKLIVQPVMTDMIHTGVWEGPCRWKAASVAQETAQAKARFAQWPQQLARQLGRQWGIELLPPIQVIFSEDFKLRAEDLERLKRDGGKADVVFISPHGASVVAFEVSRQLEKPMILDWGLNCRTVDIAAYTRSMGQEAFVPAGEEEMRQLLVALRARKVYRQTRILFPSDRGLPPVASVASVNDLKELERRYGIQVVQIPYKELAGEMDQVLTGNSGREEAEELAGKLIQDARETFIDRRYVIRSLQFYQTIKRLMGKQQCNAFTIECFEFCSSRLPERWKITPCLIHTLFKDRGIASSCEGDLGALLSMRLLMSVSQKSSHLGNTFLRAGDILAINHSAAGTKMNGFDRPGLPYKLGRFVDSGWGTKVVVDFLQNEEKRVTVVRIDPTAKRMLVLLGKLVGSAGWEGDNIGCTVEAQIKPMEGKSEDFVRQQLDYGNHLIWVYGHYSNEMQRLAETLGMEVEIVS